MPKISVIMGVYNCKNKKYLVESVKSIINQTFKDWEFIICNDGSTDDSLDFLYEISKMDNRINIITYEENHGLAYALNKCIENSKGEFIARQDDDDVSLPERFEKEINFLNNNINYDFVGTNAFVIDAFNNKWGNFENIENPIKETFFWNSPFLHPSIIFRRDALVKVNGYRIAKETKRCEDYDLFMRMYSLGMKGYNIQEKLYEYRIIIEPNKKYRPMKYRLDEAKVRLMGYYQMKVLFKGIPYIFKPIIIGLIPADIFNKIKKIQYKE